MNLTAKQQLRRNVDNGGYATPTKTYSVPAATNEDGTVNVPAQPVYGIDPNHEPIDLYMAVRTVPGGTFRSLGVNGGAIGAGSSIACPAGRRWIVLSFTCDVTASATVGNRILQCRITEGVNANPVWIGSASTAVTAAQIGGYDVGFGAPINTPSTTVRRNMANAANTNVQVRESSSVTNWQAGTFINIRDSAGIDAADTLWTSLYVIEYDA